jgi:NAD(P)-dependent dehydrogenase (short-subunit alcohol dehydrogenase family)
VTTTSEYVGNKVATTSRIGLAVAEAMLSNGAEAVVLGDLDDENLERETAQAGLHGYLDGMPASVRARKRLDALARER